MNYCIYLNNVMVPMAEKTIRTESMIIHTIQTVHVALALAGIEVDFAMVEVTSLQ